MSRRPDPPPHTHSLPCCLASDTGSEALIWLPVRQQPFNNNAIVPHSSSQCRSYTPPCADGTLSVVSENILLSEMFFLSLPTHTLPFLSAIFNSLLDRNNCSAVLLLLSLLLAYFVRGQPTWAPQRWSERVCVCVSACVCLCVVGAKPFACASQPPAVGDIWRRRYHVHRKMKSSGLKYHPQRT